MAPGAPEDEPDPAVAEAAAAASAVRAARGRAGWRWLRQDPVSESERAPPRRLDRMDLVLVMAIILVALVFGCGAWTCRAR